MPGEDYYSGLVLSEAIRKMADHHFASNTRHISLYEYQLLQTLADRIDLPLRRQAIPRAEIDEIWQELEQVYWTVFASRSGGNSLELLSVPERVLPQLSDLFGIDPVKAPGSGRQTVSEPRRTSSTVISLEAFLAGMLANARSRPTVAGARRRYEKFLDEPSQVAVELQDDELEVVNRALYQPSIPVEGSRPLFQSLQDIVASSTTVGLNIVSHQHLGPMGVLLVASEVAGSIFIIRVTTSVADAVSQRLGDAIQGQTKAGPSEKTKKASKPPSKSDKSNKSKNSKRSTA